MAINKPMKSLPNMWILTILLILPGLVSGLSILNISGPSVVVNGTTPLLVLDCEYELTEMDKHGFVVKWYFNRGPFPSYQWIPNHAPAAQGVLKGRVDETYQVSEDPVMKHRALAIRNPTVDLSGEYTCWISSWQAEAMKRKKVIIYSPAEVTLTWTKPTDTSVLLFCKASGVHPEPEMAIYRREHTENRIPIEGADIKLSQDETGYSMTLQLELYDYELEDETVFECELKIPGTEYEVQKQILYYPAVDYDYENDDELPYYFDEHQYNYGQEQKHKGGAPTTTTTTTTTPSTTTTTTTTTTSTSTAAAFVATADNTNSINNVKDHSIERDLPEHMPNNIINKNNDIEMASANKAVPVTAEEIPRVAESVSKGERSCLSLMLLCSVVVIQHILQ